MRVAVMGMLKKVEKNKEIILLLTIVFSMACLVIMFYSINSF